MAVETVTVSTELKRTGNGAEAIEVPLVARPFYKKINPLWWFGNDELSAEGNTFVYKYLRNFMQNFRWYVIGVADRPHTVTSEAPALDTQWAYPKSGWKNAKINGWLPYWSYVKNNTETSEGFVFQFGWQPRGGLSGRLTGINHLF